MNEHILMVVKWRKDFRKVTRAELNDNRDAARVCAADDIIDSALEDNGVAMPAHVYVDYASHIACNADKDANVVISASAYCAALMASIAASYGGAKYAYIATSAHVFYIKETEKYLTKYFDNTGENRQDYINALQLNPYK